MGVGKTTIGRELAQFLNIPHFDLDQIMEEKLQTSISSIFKDKGEIYFRKQEHLCLKQFLESNESFVLSLGGGTPCYANNHLLIQQDGVESFYLKATIDTIAKRLVNDKAYRPILNQNMDDTLEIFIAKHLFDRSYFYHQAKHIIPVDHKTIPSIIEEITAKID